MVLAALFVTAICGTVLAQGDGPRLSVAGGAGVARQFYGDFDFDSTPVWQVSVRGRTAEHLALEGIFEQWMEQRTARHESVMLSGPAGPMGRVALIEEREHFRMRTLAFNLLGTFQSGRATFAAGGGVGLMGYDRTFAQETSGCDAAATAAAACGSYENGFSSSSATAQAVASLDVAIARRVAVFGRYDLVLPLRDISFGHGGITGGVRVSVW